MEAVDRGIRGEACYRRQPRRSGRAGEAGPAREAQVPVPEDIDVQRIFREKYPWARISVGSFQDASQIKDYAKDHYGSFEIVISPEALERMKKDPEFLQKCEKALAEARKAQDKKIRGLASGNKLLYGRGLVLNGDGSVSQWIASGSLSVSAPRRFLASSRNGSGSIVSFKTKEGSIIVSKKRLSYNASRDLLKIARASTPQLVKSAVCGVQAQIYLLKIAPGNKREAGRLIEQAEKVALRGRLKVRLLKKEELQEIRQKRARAAGEIKRAIQMRRMLREQRQRRKSREYGEARTAYQMAIEERERRREEAFERRAEAYASTGENSVSAPSGASVGPGGFAVPGANGAGVVIDITV